MTPWGVLPGGRNLPRFFLWIGTDNHRRTPYGVADGWEIVEMRGIEPRSDSNATGLLRVQFAKEFLSLSVSRKPGRLEQAQSTKSPLIPIDKELKQWLSK